MSQLSAMMMTSNILKGAAFVLISLGVACGGSDDTSSTNSGGSTSNGGSADGGGTAVGAGGGTAVGAGGGTAAGGSTADGGNAGNPGSTAVVNLRTAGNYVILAMSGISTVPTSAVTGNLGVSPAAATFITGFSLIPDSTNVFSTSLQIVGKVYAADYVAPTPSNLTTAITDMQLAFTDAAGRAPNFTELGAGNIGGMTLTAGVYKWGTGLLIPSDVTLNGSATDVWILQIAQNLTMAGATKVVLTGGALAKNVFWQIAGATDLGTSAHSEGVILSQTSIALRTGASIKGRLLAQTAVTIDSSAVVAP